MCAFIGCGGGWRMIVAALCGEGRRGAAAGAPTAAGIDGAGSVTSDGLLSPPDELCSVSVAWCDSVVVAAAGEEVTSAVVPAASTPGVGAVTGSAFFSSPRPRPNEYSGISYPSGGASSPGGSAGGGGRSSSSFFATSVFGFDDSWAAARTGSNSSPRWMRRTFSLEPAPASSASGRFDRYLSL